MTVWDVPDARADGITVVLPTWNRAAGLRRTLDGLAAQESPGVDWDVVVVASGSDPVAHRVVSELPFPSPFDLRVVDEERTGASNARNRGLAASRRVVAFIDDDCWPEPTWLREITGPVLDGRWSACGGRVRLDAAVSRPPWLGDALLSFLSEYDRGDESVELGPEDYLLTANAAFDAARLSAAGGFDPALGPNAGVPMVDDDVDVCRKVRRSGGRIGYVPTAVVVHDLPPSRLRPAYLLGRMHAQGRSDWLLGRQELGRRVDRGVAAALGQLVREQRSILRQGPWHRSVALHSAGSLCRAAGFVRQSVSPRSGSLSPAPRRRKGAGARPAGPG